MHSSVWRKGAFILAVLAVAGVLVWGCGDDDGKVTGPNGGGSGLTVFRVDAGEYDLAFDIWPCGSTDTVRVDQTVVLCEDARPGDDDYDDVSFCDTTYLDGNRLIADCESDWAPFDGCTVIVDTDIDGTITGNTWALAGTIMYHQNPLECLGIECMAFQLTVTWTGPPPDRCQYGDLNTIDMTVTGAPFPSGVSMSARGYQREDIVAWDVVSEATLDDDPLNPIAVLLNFATPEFDRNDLPVVFNVVYDEVPAAGNTGSDVGAYYSEWSPDPYGQQIYSVESASGTLTIEAASDEFFAGSFDIDWTGSSGTPGTRNTTGTFNIDNRNYGGGGVATERVTRMSLDERLMRAATLQRTR